MHRVGGIVHEVLEQMPSAVCVLDRHGMVAYANARARELLQRPLAGLDVAEALAPLPTLLAASGEHAACEVTLPSGRLATLGYTVGHLAGGRDHRYVVSFRDISQLRALQEERDRLLKLAGVGSVLPTILHGLKNPLASITVAVEILCEEEVAADIHDQLVAVLAEIRRMRLALEGVTAIGQDLHGAGFHPIAQTVREAVSILTARAQASQVHLRADVDNFAPLPFEPAVVSAIVFNLTVNALHACAPGDTIRLHASCDGATFELTVSDTGSGMPEQVYRRCTEMFFTTRRTGSGIGLALCRQLAERAGGGLEILSVPGFGTSITVRVPVHAAASA